MFDQQAPYEHVKASGVLTRELIAKLYSLKDDDILYDGFFDAALAWKCTIIRPWAQGTIGERDTLGTAQVSVEPMLLLSLLTVSSTLRSSPS